MVFIQISHEVFINNELIDLTHTEFRLLHLMMGEIGGFKVVKTFW